MTRYKSVIIINISTFLLMLGVGMIVALLPQRIMNLSDSVSHVGYLASAFALTFVLFQIPIGNFSDKFGFKPFLVGGYFLCSVTGLLYYFSKLPNLIFWVECYKVLERFQFGHLFPPFCRFSILLKKENLWVYTTLLFIAALLQEAYWEF